MREAGGSHGQGRLCWGLPELSVQPAHSSRAAPALILQQSQILLLLPGKQSCSPRALGEGQTPARGDTRGQTCPQGTEPCPLREDAAIPCLAALPRLRDMSCLPAPAHSTPVLLVGAPKSCVTPQNSPACPSDRAPQLPPALLCLHGARHLHRAQGGHRGTALPKGNVLTKTGAESCCSSLIRGQKMRQGTDFLLNTV